MKFFVTLGILGVLVSVVDAGVSMHNPFFCYATDTIRSMTSMMATITSYEAIRRFNLTTVNPFIPTGTPSRFWYIGRYGARYPHANLQQEMINLAESSVQDDIVRNYEAGKTTLCRQDFENIRDFNLETYFEIEFTVENAYLPMESGSIAMRNIATRLQQTFPSILSQDYSPDRFHFRHNSNELTNVSIRAFASGLFGEAGSQNVIYEDVPAVDWLLRPNHFCPAFSDEIANWTDYPTAFRQGPEFEEMMEQVNTKLGFVSSNQLGFDQIFAMWNLCRFKLAETFETSNSETGGNATWCAPFSVAHHLLFEYYVDIGIFHNAGYGIRNQRLLENLNCGVMQDLLNLMQSDNNTNEIGRFFVTQTRGVLEMLLLFGSFRDRWPLHQHNFAQQSNRNWMTSLIGPLSANFAVVRYDSEDDGDHDLLFLLNETPILVPGCDQNTGACKLSVFVNRFQRFINANCEVAFCSMD